MPSFSSMAGTELYCKTYGHLCSDKRYDRRNLHETKASAVRSLRPEDEQRRQTTSRSLIF